jgi:hypothetical protein
MGLEVFGFIPDLVDTNPTATDPVAQGDDHIRGVKFTLQNQFPVIGDDAVTLTALQMNEAAIKNEANIFTVTENSFADQVNVKKTTGANLAGHFYFDENDFARWGWFLSTTGNNNNFQMQRRDAAGLLLDLPIVVRASDGVVEFADPTEFSDGNAAAPGVAFNTNPDMGMFVIGADNLGLSVAGVQKLGIDANIATWATVQRGSSGSAGAPQYSFSAESNLGIFRPGAAQLGFTAAGVEQFRISAGNISLLGDTVQLRGVDGTIAAPGYSFVADTGLGMSRTTGPAGIAFSVGGAARATLEAAQFRLGTATPILTFNSQQVRKSTTTQVAGWNFQDASGNNRWSQTVSTDANASNMPIRRFNAAGVSQGDIMVFKSNGNLNMPQLPTSSAGLVAGDLWRNPTAAGFVAII